MMSSIIQFILSNAKKIILFFLAFTALQVVGIWLNPLMDIYVWPYLVDFFVVVRFYLSVWHEVFTPETLYFCIYIILTGEVITRTYYISISIIRWFRHQDD